MSSKRQRDKRRRKRTPEPKPIPEWIPTIRISDMDTTVSMKRIGRDAEIMIYGDIGDRFDGVGAKEFAEELKSLGKVDAVDVRINSTGGSVWDSVAIMSSLDRLDAKVRVHIDGVALSAASLIAMAGDSIAMAENGLLMIHDPWSIALGTSAELREEADRLDKIEGTVRQSYARRSGLSLERIDNMMAVETWMTADEALENGFVDSITGALRVAAHVDKHRFRKTPQRLIKPDHKALDHYRQKIAEQYKAAKMR